jgi:hypothetical protein
MESGTGPFSFEEFQHEQEIETEPTRFRVAIIVAPLEFVGDPVLNRIDPD